MSRKSLATLLGFIVVLPLICHPQMAAQSSTNQKSSPDGLNLLQQAVSASGDAQALAALNHLVGTGSITYHWAHKDVTGTISLDWSVANGLNFVSNTAYGKRVLTATASSGTMVDQRGRKHVFGAHNASRMEFEYLPVIELDSILSSHSAVIQSGGEVLLGGHLADALMVSGYWPTNSLGVAAQKAYGQTYLDATGIPEFTTQFPVENGFINISNGNLHLEIDLAQPVQRGKVALNPKFVYDSRLWQLVQGYSWQLNQNFTTNDSSYAADTRMHLTGGWRFSDAFTGDTYANYRTAPCQPLNPPQPPSPPPTVIGYDSWGPWYWYDPNGTEHEFGASTTMEDPNAQANCQPYSLTGTTNSSSDADAMDGSGYHIYVTNYTNIKIVDKDGTQVCCGQIVDSNGNALYQNGSAVGITDTRGLKPLLFSDNGSNQYYFDVLGVGGAYNRYTVTTETINVSTNFQQVAVTEYSGTLTVIQSIQLPDGSSYQFQYDSGTAPGHYGEVTQVTLPTGGVIHYGYSVYNDSYQNANHWLTSRTTSDGTWTFTPSVLTQCSQSGTGCQEEVTVTPPALSAPSTSGDIVYTLTLNGGSWNTQVDRWSGSSKGGGTLLLTTKDAYSYNQTYSTFAQFVTRKSRRPSFRM